MTKKKQEELTDPTTKQQNPQQHELPGSQPPGSIFSIPDFVRFFLVTVLTAPPNFLWQAWLERTFPGRPRSTITSGNGSSSEGIDDDSSYERVELAEAGGGGGGGIGFDGEKLSESRIAVGEGGLAGQGSGGSAQGLRKRNVVIKWFVDCMTVGALVNTAVFLVLMGLLKGKSLGDIQTAVRTETIPIIVAGYKIWPLASVVNFTLIPVEKRIVFLSAVGWVWGIYMSLVAAKQ